VTDLRARAIVAIEDGCADVLRWRDDVAPGEAVDALLAAGMLREPAAPPLDAPLGSCRSCSGWGRWDDVPCSACDGTGDAP